jgi:hypothetical protein
MNGPIVPNHNPQALIADMWRSCPSFCSSIRQDFDLNAIFHPALIAYHGEAFLRLAASQIAMQNQSFEMAHMRNALCEKQKLLDVNAASAKDLQTKLSEQQSELREIKILLEQQSQYLTNPVPKDNGQALHNRSERSDVVSQTATVSPATSVSTLADTDGQIGKFYGRSAAQPPLNLTLPYDNVDGYDEEHGYGHAETHGPSFRFDLVEDSRSDQSGGRMPAQSTSVPPNVSTSPVFELDAATAKPIVSILTKEQAIVQDNRETKKDGYYKPSGGQISAVGDIATSTSIRIMKRDNNEEVASDASKLAQTFPGETSKEATDKPIADSTIDVKSDNGMPEKMATIIENKPTSYAAAVRTAPGTPPTENSIAANRLPPASKSSPAPDLGFTLEPLPKPTMEQVQSQQQQLQTPNTDNKEEAPAFDFQEWKQRRMAKGIWEDRPRRQDNPRPNHQPYNSIHGGRGGRFHRNNENPRYGGVSGEEGKRQWLAWKQGLVSQGKWNPKHSFREA